MGRNITALYRTHAVADLVRRELAAEGVAESDIHIIPDRADAGTDYQDFDDQLHDLHLPDDDLRTYQHCVRQGDVVVSVEADDDDEDDLIVTRIRQIMRRPETEAHQLETRGRDYAGQTIYPHSDPSRAAPGMERQAQQDPAYPDPFVRSYRRGSL